MRKKKKDIGDEIFVLTEKMKAQETEVKLQRDRNETKKIPYRGTSGTTCCLGALPSGS
jgi:hypothetical protein